MIRSMMKKIMGESATNDAIPEKDPRAELLCIEERMESYAYSIKKHKALIDYIDTFPDGTWLVISEEDPQKLEDQRKYERYDGWQKESLLLFVKGQYSDQQSRLRDLKKKHKELKEIYDAPE